MWYYVPSNFFFDEIAICENKLKLLTEAVQGYLIIPRLAQTFQRWLKAFILML